MFWTNLPLKKVHYTNGAINAKKYINSLSHTMLNIMYFCEEQVVKYKTEPKLDEIKSRSLIASKIH